MRRPGRPYGSGSAPKDTWVGGDRASTARPRSDRSTSRVRACAALPEGRARFGPRARIGTRLGSSPCGDGPNEPKAQTKIPPSTSWGADAEFQPNSSRIPAEFQPKPSLAAVRCGTLCRRAVVEQSQVGALPLKREHLAKCSKNALPDFFQRASGARTGSRRS